MYEIGDKVIYQGADKSAYKKVGVLKSIEEKDGKPQLTVEFEGGETFTAPVDDWSKEFTNACKNAEFKVGDKVIVKGKIVGSKQHDGEVGVVKSIAGTGKPGDPVTVEVHYGPNATWKSGDVVYASPSILKLANSCISTNSVVANAMAANRRVARNASGDDKTRFFAELDKIKAKLASGFGDIEDLLYEAEHGEYDGYELAAVRARTYNDMADKLGSSLSRR